jgi:hypothetical protein
MGINLPKFDKYDSKALAKKFDIDPFYSEYENLSNKLKFAESSLIPTLKVEIKDKKSTEFWFAFTGGHFAIKDIAKSYPADIIKTQTLLKNIEYDTSILNKEITLLKFERNKIFFTEVVDYYSLVRSYKDYKLDSVSIVYSSVPLDIPKDGTLSVYYSLLPIKSYNKILQETVNIERARYIAYSPVAYGLAPYFFPSIIASGLSITDL